MRITYYEETDSAVIVLRDPGPDTVGEIAGEDLPEPALAGVVLHRDDAGELYEVEIYSSASKRLALDKLDFERVPGKGFLCKGDKRGPVCSERSPTEPPNKTRGRICS